VSAGDWIETFPGVLGNEPLARHSQFGVGGPARWFITTRDTGVLAELLRRSADSGVPVTMLGAGSNTLISDDGIDGLVIRHDDRRLRVIDDQSIELGAGCMMPRVALDCASRGLAGLEFGIGVPGTLGASVYGNAGAFGAEMADVLIDCTSLDPGGAPLTLTAAECDFSYRRSCFKDEFRNNAIVGARLRVHADDPDRVRERTDSIQTERKASQPYGIRSLGSVFKNPPGDRAGRLIEAAGLKGRRSGGAQISEKHANFIVNAHHATAADVLDLVRIAHDTVREQFNIDLEREIIVLGGRASDDVSV
jgi:UDP-N-acetylmuramate dehydrogenase